MAKAHSKSIIKLDSGVAVEAQTPVIVSASRATDIPAFYADWFFDRLKKGYSAWTNPFNGVTSYISFQKTRFIVFWSKNPRPLLRHLDYLRERQIGCYVQFTLNDYENEELERGIPPLSQRIETFRRLVDKLGEGRVIWRFDPMILTDRISIDDLLGKVIGIGEQLRNWTEKLVFSFADIASYRKVKANLEKNGVNYIEWTEEAMIEFASRLSELNRVRGWNYRLATCGEKIDLEKYGIEHNRCIDDELMIRFAYEDTTLMDFLNVKIEPIQSVTPSMFQEFVDETSVPSDAIMLPSGNYAIRTKSNKDKGQRQFCGCIISKDIGQYDTCPHLCEYCYANNSKQVALANWQRHKQNPFGDKIIG